MGPIAVRMARAWYDSVLDRPPADPDRLWATHNLGHQLDHSSEYEEAERLIRTVWQVRIDLLGSGHAHTLSTAVSMANILFSQDKLEDATLLYSVTLTGLQRMYGVGADETLSCICNLANTLIENRQYAVAAIITRKTLDTRPPNDTHMTATSIADALACALGCLGRKDEAVGIYREIIVVRERVYGTDHELTKVVKDDLAHILAEN